MKKKLAIFDFDGTLVDTPLPDVGKEHYLKTTGQAWPHQGWWGRHESLDLNVFEMPTVETVISDYHKEKTSDDTIIVLLTGRLLKLSEHVKAILTAKGLHFDEYHFNTGGATEMSKIKSMEHLLSKYPGVEIIEMWDDRLAHIPIFETWGQSQVTVGRLKDFKINIVPTSHHGE